MTELETRLLEEVRHMRREQASLAKLLQEHTKRQNDLTDHLQGLTEQQNSLTESMEQLWRMFGRQ